MVYWASIETSTGLHHIQQMPAAGLQHTEREKMSIGSRTSKNKGVLFKDGGGKKESKNRQHMLFPTSHRVLFM